jgi:hypothetical protein
VLGLDGTPPGRALVEFMDDKVAHSGPGLYGFSINEAPFDESSCRRLLARLVFDLAHAMHASRSQPDPTWAFLYEAGYEWRYPSWLALAERFYDGLRRSFAGNDSPPPLALDFDLPLRAAVDVHRWLPVWRDLRFRRERAGRWAVASDPAVELAAVDHLVRATPHVPPAYRWPGTAPALGALLACRAELLEHLGRIADAAAAWRDVAAAEPDPAAADVAREIARRLGSSAT